jgi:hypothetical protein
MFVSNAMAATDAPVPAAPLSPGKPAGVQQADLEGGGVLLFLGIAVLAGGIALLATQTQGKGGSSAGTQ